MATSRRQVSKQTQDEGQARASSASSPRTQSSGASAGQVTRRTRSNARSSNGRGNGTSRARLNNSNAEKLARGLGWFSLGLGLAELLAPRAIAKISGTEGKHTGLIRLYGLREIASGIGIFMQGERPSEAVWSRVVGDALDIATLAVAFASPKSSKGRVAFATANVLAVTALDVLCAQQLSANETGGTQVKKSIIINGTPEEIYKFWHDFENLPRFMKHLESVRTTGEGRSHWVAKAPAGTTVEWDAEITEDRPNELIAWRSVEGADVDNAGSVTFETAPGGRGTIVKVDLEYSAPGGVVGTLAAKLFGEEPAQQINDDLRRLKQVIEVGEVIVSDGTYFDNGLLTQRAAQPTPNAEAGQSQGASTS
jgi:uncharacterized membrane protein